MGKNYRIFVLNPGSTSTKVAYCENERKICQKTLQHSSQEIAKFKFINDQYDMRRQAIEDYLKEIGVDLSKIDVIASRGGGGRDLRGGGYLITKLMVEECRVAPWPHASNLGVMIAYDLMCKGNIPGYIYDSPRSDDFCEYAKVSGLPEFPTLRGAGHPLNEKAAAHKVAHMLNGKYEDFNFVVSHLGGGITVCAHQKGKIIDTTINAFSPERAGALPMISFTKACYSGERDLNSMIKRQMGNGGLVAYLGTNNLQEVERRIDEGDKNAEFYFNAMIYQIAKDIGSMATTMCSNVDRIVLTGAMANSKRLTEGLRNRVQAIAPVEVVAGTFEMEALVQGTLRILRGEENARDYDTENAE